MRLERRSEPVREDRANALQELLACVTGACHPKLPKRMSEVLLARAAGGSVRSAAHLLHFSESHVRRQWLEVKAFLLYHAGLAWADDFWAGVWFALHQTCCLRGKSETTPSQGTPEEFS